MVCYTSTEVNNALNSLSNECNGVDTVVEMDSMDNKRDDSAVLTISGDVQRNEQRHDFIVESHTDNNSSGSVESIKTSESISDQPNSDDSNYPETEKWYKFCLQVAIPFAIAGMGTIAAGIILGYIEKQKVFQDVGALLILIPAIIGLKGNLDMCLASRLSTQANLGNMVQPKETMKMIFGNVALVQVQAIVAAFCASIFAVCTSSIFWKNDINLKSTILVISCSLLTATLACFVLDFLLSGLIFLAHKFKLNPDNLATPIAASVGDLVSLLVLSQLAQYLYKIIDSYYWVPYIIIACYGIILLPFWICAAWKNKYTRPILKDGWLPVFIALFVSGCSGLLLNNAVNTYAGFVLFQPIVNGIGGNLVSVQASRTSTMLHKTSILGIIPPHTKHLAYPWEALYKGVLPAKTARILILMIIPGQTLFVLIADAIYNGVSTITYVFYITYIVICVFQVITLLYVCHLLVHGLWKIKVDPDNHAIPYLTALGDLLGTGFLFLAFWFTTVIGWEYTPIA